MATKRERDRDKIAKALGASVTIDLGKRSHGPLGWMHLAYMVQDRLVSRGGRPSDPEWDTKRLVPFKRETWRRLSDEAQAISAHGRKVGPAQLAAILIEQGLDSKPGLRPSA